jgi:hypothetical protein
VTTWAPAKALEEQVRIFERLPDSVSSDKTSATGWPVTRLLHTRSFVTTHSGRADAEQAQREAFAAYPSSRLRQRAQVQLHEALSAVLGGDVPGGLDHARHVLANLPAHDQTRFVRYAAATVLEAVPQQERSRPVVLEYQDYLVLPKPSQQRT